MLGLFLKIYIITRLFCALLSLPVICYLIEILLVVREWEWEGMGISNGNENEPMGGLSLKWPVMCLSGTAMSKSAPSLISSFRNAAIFKTSSSAIAERPCCRVG